MIMDHSRILCRRASAASYDPPRLLRRFKVGESVNEKEGEDEDMRFAKVCYGFASLSARALQGSAKRCFLGCVNCLASSAWL